jgi:hypothetical protein
VHQQIRNEQKKERKREKEKWGKKIKVLRGKNEENPRKERKKDKGLEEGKNDSLVSPGVGRLLEMTPNVLRFSKFPSTSSDI